MNTHEMQKDRGRLATQFTVSQQDMRVWAYAAPFIGLALAVSGIHPHDPMFFAINDYDMLWLFLLYGLPVLLPLKRFFFLPAGLGFALATLLIYGPLLESVRQETSWQTGFIEFYWEGEVVFCLANGLINLCFAVPLILVKVLVIEGLLWPKSRNTSV